MKVLSQRKSQLMNLSDISKVSRNWLDLLPTSNKFSLLLSQVAVGDGVMKTDKDRTTVLVSSNKFCFWKSHYIF